MGYTIGLKTDSEVVAKRLKQDPDREEYAMELEEIKMMVEERDRKDLERYEKVYGVNFSELMSEFNLMLDTSYLSKETTQNIINASVGEWLEQNYNYRPPTS